MSDKKATRELLAGVKSCLVCSVKSARPAAMIVVRSTACMTEAAVYMAVTQPTRKLMATVKRPRRIKLAGTCLRSAISGSSVTRLPICANMITPGLGKGGGERDVGVRGWIQAGAVEV